MFAHRALAIAAALTLTLLTALAFGGPAPAAAQTLSVPNGDFEIGMQPGWTASAWGSASTANNAHGFSPKSGSKFALLGGTGCPGSGTWRYQTLTLAANVKIVGYAFFKTTDFVPYTDWGQVTVNGKVVFTANVATVGDFMQTPWTRWEYTTKTAGQYTIQAKVENVLDCELPSYLGLDGITTVSLNPAVPMPDGPSTGTVYILGAVPPITCAGGVKPTVTGGTPEGVGTFRSTCGTGEDAPSVTYIVTYKICAQTDLKVGKGHDTIPIKIELCDARGRNVSSANVRVRATIIGTYPVAAIARVKDESTDFKFQGSERNGRYHFNLKLDGTLTTGSYPLSISVAGDPVVHTLTITLR